MKTERTRSGLSILAGGLFFVGAANAVDIVVDGSYESSTNKITGFVGVGGDDNAGLDGGWTHYSTYTYSANYTQSGPPASGRVYLRPYADAASSQTVSQTNSLARAITTAQIDNLTGQYTLSAWFSTYKDQNDYSELTLQFLDSAMVNAGSPIPLGGAAFVAGLPGGAGLRAWGRDTKTGIIPPGARYAAITTVSHAQVDLPDGYADLVSLDITAGFVPVQVTSASPANNAANVKPEAILSVTLRDGTAPLNTNSIRLSYDNAPVTPSIQKSGTGTTVQYDPPGLLASLSPHNYEIAFNNAGDATPNTTNRYTFTVPNLYEDFETAQALDDWSADNGTWEIGRPTFGPSTNSIGQRAFAGTNCAATVLGGNYGTAANSRLISPSFVVPPAASYPRLRFSHWFDFWNLDKGRVEIRTVGSTTWTGLSSDFFYTSSGAWSRTSIDLSAFAGKTVQIAFRIIANGDGFVSSGWYVDEVAVVNGPLISNTPENWETGFGDWSAEYGTWEVGTPSVGPASAHEGANCAGTALRGNYATSADSRLISPLIVVPPAASNPRLRFWHWYDFWNLDKGVVEIKVAGATNWTSIAPDYINTSSGVWSRPSIDLSVYAGKTVQIAFRILANGDGFVSSGWYIDEVRLTHDFALLLVDSPIIRAQDTFCVSLGIAAASPASSLSFTLQAPAGHLSNLSLNGTGCWTNAIITPQPESQWYVTMQNHCTTAAMGVQTIGSLCFTAVSPHSAFVPLTINNLVVTNVDASIPLAEAFVSRAVVIANEPLLEVTVATNRQRMLTIFGKRDTSYEIQYAEDLGGATPWSPGWTNTVPTSMFYSFPIQGSFSSRPALYLRGLEK